MQEFLSPRSVWDFAFRQLRLGEVIAESGLLHGFADGSFGVVLFYVSRGEGILLEPCVGVIELDVVSRMTRRIFCRQCGIDLGFEFMRVQIRGGNAQLLRGIGQGGDPVPGGAPESGPNPHPGTSSSWPPLTREDLRRGAGRALPGSHGPRAGEEPGVGVGVVSVAVQKAERSAHDAAEARGPEGEDLGG